MAESMSAGAGKGQRENGTSQLSPHAAKEQNGRSGLSDLMVHLDGTGEDEIRIAHAEAIAAICDAHLTGIYTNILPDYGMAVAGDFSGGAAAAMFDVEERVRSEGTETFRRLGERFSRLGVRNELRRLDESPGAMAVAVAAEARWSDLFVATCPYRQDAVANWDDVLETVLFEGGHAVYFAPPGLAPRVRLSRVLIAWTDTREAARAVAEALPFLRAASETEIVTVDGSGERRKARGFNAADMAAHLDRWGARVVVRPLDKKAQTVSQVLLDETRRASADLIVMGAYGHSRWREWIIGGTTREMLAMAEVPVLMAH
jgi:nucleotide-binding universal stress UspA family protein